MWSILPLTSSLESRPKIMQPSFLGVGLLRLEAVPLRRYVQVCCKLYVPESLIEAPALQSNARTSLCVRPFDILPDVPSVAVLHDTGSTCHEKCCQIFSVLGFP